MQIKEEWKDINENITSPYGIIYQVSNIGRVRNLTRIYYDNRNRKRVFNGKILKPLKLNNGYLTVWLIIDGKRKKATIHRLVAKTFLNNPNCFPIVNHIDGNKENNNISNIEWCTYKHNSDHAIKTGLRSKFNIDKHTLEALYKTKTAQEIGGIYGYTGSYINKILKGYNIKRRESGARKVDINREKLFDMKVNGNSNAEIARVFNVDQSTISRRINKLFPKLGQVGAKQCK